MSVDMRRPGVPMGHACIAVGLLLILSCAPRLSIAKSSSELPSCSLWKQHDQANRPVPACAVQGLYTGWLSHTNMGDEIVLDTFLELLKLALQARLPNATVTLEYEHTKGPAPVHGSALHDIAQPRMEHLQASDFLILGGGSLLEVRETQYTRLTKFAGEQGVPVYYHATGSQYPDDDESTKKNDVAALKAAIAVPLKFGGMRGQLGLDRMHKYDPSFDVPVIYDSALLSARLFALQPTSLARTMRGVLANGTAPPVCFAGTEHKVNWWFVAADGANSAEKAAAIFAELARNFTLVLVPVDLSSLQRAQLIREAAMKLGVPSGRLLVHHGINDWAGMLSVLSLCRVTISDRLHGGILSAAAGTPFSFAGYSYTEFKQRDFAESVGQLSLTGPGDRDLSTSDQVARIQKMIGQLLEQRSGLARSLLYHQIRAFQLHMQAMDRWLEYMSACRASFGDALRRENVVRVRAIKPTKYQGCVITIDACGVQ